MPVRCLGVLVWSLTLASVVMGQEDPMGSTLPGVSRALIIVGLPGDPEHDALFRSTTQRWRDWLTSSLGFAPGEVRVLSGQAPDHGSSDAPSTRDSLRVEIAAIRKVLKPEDRLWVFVLGHANIEENHAFLHLPGPDLRDDEFAALFRGISCREQVFWMTMAGSGSFLPGLSAPGRVVVAATEATGEVNETEFPHALVDVARKPSGILDMNKDGQVSVQEVFLATVDSVESRFASDKRLPTEHARLDDNGDGVGTEPKDQHPPPNPDGALASRTFLPTPPIRSENGSNRIVPSAR